MDWKQVALERLKQIEGGYVNDPFDRGGETNHGITIRVARENDYTGDMRSLTLQEAQRIYLACYWHPLQLDTISQTMPLLALELFDTSVNCGVGITGIWLQDALNSLNDNVYGEGQPIRLRYGADLKADGKVGPATLNRIKQVEKHRGSQFAEQALKKAVDGQQCNRYINLGRKNYNQRRFTFGWLMNRVG